MKRLFFLLFFILGLGSAFAQETARSEKVDSIDVGPYKVYYSGAAPTEWKLDSSIDLYEFFDLSHDTVRVEVMKETPVIPKVRSLQFGVSAETAKHLSPRSTFALALEASWKQRINRFLCINAGVAPEMVKTKTNFLRYDVLEMGVPISAEFARLNFFQPSLFASVGITPGYYATMKAQTTNAEQQECEKYSGFLLTPTLTVGSYVPVGEHFVRMAIYARMKFNLSAGEYDLYHETIGCGNVGAQISFVF